MTLPEFVLAHDGWLFYTTGKRPGDEDPMSRDELDDLMEQFPDE